MITLTELNILKLDSTQESIECNIGRKPTDIALDKRVEHSAIVASQVKYLQRAKSKLPSYFAARCIIPSLAFEQSSSEQSAATKTISGDSLLELTCGLGVDTLHLSKHFTRVTTLERDPILAAVAVENFKRLGVDNIEVINSSAEEFLAQCNEQFDWIYADPDRRSTDGHKMVRLEDCSPNMLSLHDKLNSLTQRGVSIKCSPMFDIDEAFRLYPNCDVEIVSSHDECKEVVITAPHTSSSHTNKIIISRIGYPRVEFTRAEVEQTTTTKPFDPQRYSWLTIPDVALQKGRVALHALGKEADIWSNNGFAFSPQKPTLNLGRSFEILEVVDYQPKALNKKIGKRGVELFKRDFAIPQSQISSHLKLKSGADIRIALTTIEGRNLAIFLKI